MYNSFYFLSFNPFDKQQLPEEDCFKYRDFDEMTSRLNFLKDTRGIGLFTASPGMANPSACGVLPKALTRIFTTWSMYAFQP